MHGRALSLWAVAAVLAVLVPAGMVWLIAESLELIWDGDPGTFLTAVFIILIFVRIIAFFAMLFALCAAFRAVFRALTSKEDGMSPNSAITFYALVVVYTTFGMVIPLLLLPGAGFFEPAVYLVIALVLLLAVRLRTGAGGDSIDIGTVAIPLSHPDARRATRLALLATAAILGATAMYGWLVLRRAVMDCFVPQNCSTDFTLGVLAAMTAAGVLTAGIVLWSLRTRVRVTTLGIMASTLYGCLALVALALPLSTLMPYDFVAVAAWYGIAGLAFLVCQSRFEDEPWPFRLTW